MEKGARMAQGQQGVAGGLLKAGAALRRMAQAESDRAAARTHATADDAIAMETRMHAYDNASEALDDQASDMISEALTPILGYKPCAQLCWDAEGMVGGMGDGMPTSVCLIPAGVEHEHG